MRGSLGSRGGGRGRSDRWQLGIGIKFFLLLYNGGGGGGGVRPMGGVGFRNKGSMGKGLTLYLSNF